MNNNDNHTLIEIKQTLQGIHKTMLNVFWIVAIFALLYFGLMVYLLFIKG